MYECVYLKRYSEDTESKATVYVCRTCVDFEFQIEESIHHWNVMGNGWWEYELISVKKVRKSSKEFPHFPSIREKVAFTDGK